MKCFDFGMFSDFRRGQELTKGHCQAEATAEEDSNWKWKMNVTEGQDDSNNDAKDLNAKADDLTRECNDIGLPPIVKDGLGNHTLSEHFPVMLLQS